MYFTVDGEENSFSIGGAIHYSLAGEKALFRVRKSCSISCIILLLFIFYLNLCPIIGSSC